MKYCILTAGIAVAACSIAQPALAATGNVTFNGTVAAICTLVVTNGSGTMTVSPGLQSLSSHNAGGVAGTITATTTGNVAISIGAPTAITVPPADVTPITWAPTYSVAGAHTVAETGASSNLSTPGVDTVTVHLTGTKTGSDIFAAGNYSATVTVTCQ
ncbi:hypothetical protein EDC40_106176 [Aminobacter aminovorans]|uniref:Spore coat protein U domain-containing protein n=1 Tax=Aminobacter aminovorans TaxID=83263 RepID=A0A380WDL7_AMIAI|nr:hypothetical protein [Aminobacter aminovorans]TCS25380.1 hypothetical protein EDC40_106176 [Aminobacter aminovorans]SUU87030.1 Uncharacterised protein [Aminobacter aminovorans]